MRKVIGVVLLILGIPILTAGAYAAVLIGPDDTAETGPHRLSSDGSAIVTTPDVLAYVGPTLHLTVTRPDGGAVFVGIGPRLDVTSYLGDAPHREVSDVVLPWTVTSAEVGTGAPVDLPPPAEQPWWIRKAAGEGSATLVWPIVDGSYRIVGANGDGSPGVELDVTVGLELEGAFYGALAIALLGLLLLLLGLLMLLWRRLRFGRSAGQTAAAVVSPPPRTGIPERPAAPSYAPAATYQAAAFERPGDAPTAAAPPVAAPPDDPATTTGPWADGATEPAVDDGASSGAYGGGQPAWPFSDLDPSAGEPADDDQADDQADEQADEHADEHADDTDEDGLGDPAAGRPDEMAGESPDDTADSTGART